MANSNFYEDIDRYLDGELSSGESEQFEAALAADAGLEEAVKQHLLLREGLQAMRREEMRRQIRQWRQAPKPAERSTLRSLAPRLAAAASVLLLIGAALFIYLPSRYTNEALAGRAYELDPAVLSGLKSGAQNPLEEAVAAFEAQEYQRAAELLRNFPDNDRALYALGHSYYQLGDYPQAAAAFQQVLDRGNPEFVENAQWYALLSRLGANQVDASFEQELDRIIEAQGYYARQAEQLKKGLGSVWR